MEKTIVLVHGAWLTPASWDLFRSLYESRGYRVLAPAWPGLEGPLSTLRHGVPAAMARRTIKDLVDHYARTIQALPSAPILVGHSFGGLIVQLLADRGLGCAAVAIDPAPPRGVFPPPSALKAALPVLLTWAGWNRVHTMGFKGFCATFANTLPPAGQREAYDSFIVQAPGRIYFQAAFGIGNGLDFGNRKRPPLLLIAGEEDRTAPASMVRANAKRHGKSPVRVDYREFAGRSHWLVREPGWEAVAEAALDWAEQVTGSATSAKDQATAA